MDTKHNKNETAAREIAHAAARFISEESNRQSLITVTHADVSPDSKNATIYISVLPESEEEAALHFLKRLRGEFRGAVMKEVRLARIPYFDFAIDVGEKHRREVDRVSQEIAQREE